MAHDQPQYTGEQERADHVAAQPAHQQRQAHIHRYRNRDVVAVLPHHERIALQVAHETQIRLTTRVIPKHPAHVRKPEAAPGAVGIALRIIDVAMMSAMPGAPQQHAVLQRHRTKQQVDDLQDRMGLVGRMGE